MDLEKLFLKAGIITYEEYDEIQLIRQNPELLPRFEHGETEVDLKSDEVIKYNLNFYDGIREAVLYQSLNHPNIIKCHDVSIFDYLPTISPAEASEILKGVKMTFSKYISCDSEIFKDIFYKDKDRMFINMFVDITSAMHYLACSEVLHGDIKLANIFYDPKKDSFLLPDFDHAVIGKDNYHLRPYTPNTKPPEIDFIVKGVNDERGDIYSLAVSLISLYMNWPENWHLKDERIINFNKFVRYMDNNPGPEVLSTREAKEAILSHNEKLVEVAKNNIPFGDILIKMASFDYSERPDIRDITQEVYLCKPLKLQNLTFSFIETFPEIWKLDKHDAIYLYILAFNSALILREVLSYPISLPIKNINTIEYTSDNNFIVTENLARSIERIFKVNPNDILTQEELNQLGEHYEEITHEKLIAKFFKRKGYKLFS